MRVVVTLRDQNTDFHAPPGWALVELKGREFTFERMHPTASVLEWGNALEEQKVIGFSFKRLSKIDVTSAESLRPHSSSDLLEADSF